MISVSKEETLGTFHRDNEGAFRFTEEVRSEIWDALNKRRRLPCPLCETNDWTLADGFLPLALQEDFYTHRVGGPALPCVALVCNHCGNTHLINLLTIGLGYLVEKLQMATK